MRTSSRSVPAIGLPGFALHQEVLSAGENKRLIERLLSELCQRQVIVEYATMPEPTEEPAAPARTAPPPDAPPIVQDIVNLFNATLDRPRAA